MGLLLDSIRPHVTVCVFIYYKYVCVCVCVCVCLSFVSYCSRQLGQHHFLLAIQPRLAGSTVIDGGRSSVQIKTDRRVSTHDQYTVYTHTHTHTQTPGLSWLHVLHSLTFFSTLQESQVLDCAHPLPVLWLFFIKCLRRCRGPQRLDWTIKLDVNFKSTVNDLPSPLKPRAGGKETPFTPLYFYLMLSQFQSYSGAVLTR